MGWRWCSPPLFGGGRASSERSVHLPLSPLRPADYQPKLYGDQPKLPSSDASITSSASRIRSRGFHSSISSSRAIGTPDVQIFTARAFREITRWSDRGIADVSPPKGIAVPQEERPASASGRRAQANSLRYQPVRLATATPYSEEWMNQPLPR